MNTNPTVFASVMQLPEAERFEIAMAILDVTSPSAMTEDEIILEASQRQDEIESGSVKSLSYDELLQGLNYRPRSLA
jgi:hypothetical protein